jgi:hypothetical protein
MSQFPKRFNELAENHDRPLPAEPARRVGRQHGDRPAEYLGFLWRQVRHVAEYSEHVFVQTEVRTNDGWLLPALTSQPDAWSSS